MFEQLLLFSCKVTVWTETKLQSICYKLLRYYVLCKYEQKEKLTHFSSTPDSTSESTSETKYFGMKSKLFWNFIHLFIHVEQCVLGSNIKLKPQEKPLLVGMQLNILVWNNDWLQLRFSQEISSFLFQFSLVLWHLLSFQTRTI